jgi:hypothetical protein
VQKTFDGYGIASPRSLRVYHSYLAKFPTPGGNGAHRGIYAAGCMGYRAGLGKEQIFEDIRAHMPSGSRHVPDREIEDGVRQAFVDATGGSAHPPRPATKVALDALAKLIHAGKGANAADIAARSPISIDWHEHESMPHILETLYAPDDLIFIGDDAVPGVVGSSIKPQAELLEQLNRICFCPWPKWIPNPLTGLPATKKSGNGTTLRGDGCVATHRLVVVEHDKLSLDDQLAFWIVAPLPVAALVFSGSKSIHGLVQVDCTDAAEWNNEIVDRLFPEYLTPLGFDPACKNASRLSRAPGHIRKDTGLCQRLIYLAPGGKAVSA